MTTREPGYYRDILNQLTEAAAPKPSRQDLAARQTAEVFRRAEIDIPTWVAKAKLSWSSYENEHRLSMIWPAPPDQTLGNVQMQDLEIQYVFDDLTLNSHWVSLPHAVDPDEWDTRPTRNEFLTWANGIWGGAIGITRLTFIDWNDDGNPWYTFGPQPGSFLDQLAKILENPKIKQALRNALMKNH
jgi:hypothetical protein